MSNNIDVNKQYRIKSEIDHVLDRPGTWIGSTTPKLIDYPLYVPSKNMIQQIPRQVYIAGLLKLIDEVLSNSVDEFRRPNALFKIKNIDVTVNNDGFIKIRDDGGIPVVMHESGMILPQLIFGNLRTSSNYDDTQERDVVGTNGLGAKVANIFSSFFTVTTCDGKNKITIKWTNNMKNVEIGPIIPSNEHYTEITYKIEIHRFDLDDLGPATIRIAQKRCIDAAGVNQGLLINFNTDLFEGKLNSTWKFDNFEDYIKLHVSPEQEFFVSKGKQHTIAIIPTNIGFNYGSVNGAVCSEGTHIKKIQTQICDYIVDLCHKNDMDLITDKDVIPRFNIFVACTVFNPKYDSQDKVRLDSKINKYDLLLDDKFLLKLKTSSLYESIKSIYDVKYAEAKKIENRKLNATLKTTKSKKFISSDSSNNAKSELWIFEGTSASGGFRLARQIYQSAYLLRGKILNAFNLDKTEALENLEIREICAGSNLLFGEPAHNVKNCKFRKFVFATDMDHDGNHIASLLIAFFAKFFPELFKAGMIYRAISPIVVAVNNKTKEKKYFYNHEEYEIATKNNSLKNHEIIYTKGLGGLSDDDYFILLNSKKLIKFELTDVCKETIDIWFRESSELRKQVILSENDNESEDE